MLDEQLGLVKRLKERPKQDLALIKKMLKPDLP